MKRRSRPDIAAEVLYAAQDGALKTEMMYKAQMSFPQIEEYLDLLIGQGLVKHLEGNVYQTTDKGMRFLKMYKDVGWMLLPKAAA